MRDELTVRAEARLSAVLGGKYRLDRVLGVGGMAAVYSGFHRNGNPVAVKVLHADLSLDADARGRFLREGYIANRVDHRGVVRVIDDDTAEDGSVFLVMELLHGQTLDERLIAAGGKLPAADVCAVALQLLDVLVAAHANGVVHRDIKPGNVFVTTESTVKVLDFGIARLRELGAKHTHSGLAIGTPAFMPPEQARGRKEEVDGQSDLWAVGATMFELLSGEYVHGGTSTVEELFIASATRPARSLRGTPGVSDALAAVVDRALAFEKKDRWPTALAMREALEGAADLTPGATRLLPRTPDTTGPATAIGPLLERATTAQPPALDDGEGRTLRRPSTVDGVARPVGEKKARRTGFEIARIAAVLAVLGGLALVAHWVGARGDGPSAIASPSAAALDPSTITAPASATALPAATPAAATEPAPPASAVAPTVDVASLPQARAAVAPAVAWPSRPGAAPRASASPAAAGSRCHLESYVEAVKGEPVTRYRQVCP